MFGHEDKIKLFKKLAQEDKLTHAYLFFGERQIGKRLFAESFAYFLEYGAFDVLARPFLDTRIFTPNEKGVIGIDAMRELRQFLSQKPFSSKKRIAIIDGAETLTEEAQSSVLKIVEEPPEHALIIVIAHDKNVIFAPLLSRLTKVYFERFSRAEIRDFLIKEYHIAKDRAENITEHSFGKIGRAIIMKDNESLSPTQTCVGDDMIEKNIVHLYLENAEKNSAKLVWLLQKETAFHRFNLNQNLQERAVTAKLQ